MTADRLARVARRRNAIVTVRGRKSGRPRTVTTWFVADGSVLWLETLDPERNWPRNLLANPDVEIAIAEERFRGKARPIDGGEELEHLRRRFSEKYWIARLASWLGKTARLGFRIDLDP